MLWSKWVSSLLPADLGSKRKAKEWWRKNPLQVQLWVHFFFFHLLECDYQPVPVLQATLKRDCYLCMAAGKCYGVRAGVFWTGEFASFQNIPMVNEKMRIVNAVVVWQSEWWENIMLVIFNVLIKYSMWEENGNVCWNRGLLQLNKSCISMC